MTCKDCIYYKKCISLICHGMGYDFVTGEYITNIETFCNSFKNKAECVEVVRCKDCKHYTPQSASVHWHSTKLYCMRKAATKVNADDFCSYGEKI